MKISVITVCYNAVDTIEKTFESIYSQTYENIEHVVIDGGSTDGTLDIIEKYKDKITYFVSEPDNGIYNAMNKGIQASTGDILFFLNSGDLLYSSDIIEKILKEFEKSQKMMIYGNILIYGQNQEEKFYKFNDFDALSFTLENICHQCIFYKKDLFDKFGLYQENYKILADYDFNLNSFVKNKQPYKHVDIIVSKFQRGGISTSENIEDQKLFKESVEKFNMY